MAHLLT